MKFTNGVLTIMAVLMSVSVQAATLTKIDKMDYDKLEQFRRVAVQAQKLAYSKYPNEMAFEVAASKVAKLGSTDPLEPVQAALTKLSYGNASIAQLSDIDDQIVDTISAAFSVDLAGVPAKVKAQMQKLVDLGQRSFDYGDDRILVFQATSMDANHYEISAIVVYDVKSAEVLAVTSQQTD
jgi:hypothetical protein